MLEFVSKMKDEEAESISVYFNIEEDKILKIGERMNELNEQAYMNGYNWEAFLNHYLSLRHPELLDHMDTDPEAGTYVAYYRSSTETDRKADKLVWVIKDLVENDSKIYEFLSEHGEDIEWD